MTKNGKRLHIISLLVEDRFGVLQRIAGVFSRRGFNMDTITVGRTNIDGSSRMTITTTGDDWTVEQIIKQLNKLVDTIKVSQVDSSEAVIREIALIKIHVKDSSARSEVLSYVNIFRGRVVDVCKRSMMVEVTGQSIKIDAFLDLIRPFGVKDMVRTGLTALARGD